MQDAGNEGLTERENLELRSRATRGATRPVSRKV